MKRSRNAKELITKGMTVRDVLSLIGQPDGISDPHVSTKYGLSQWYYGTTIIHFNVVAIVDRVEQTR